MALKEWAAVVEALASGEQLLLLRKGGIHDPRGAFGLQHREFLLYPTYEHEKREAIRTEFHGRFAALLDRRQEPAQISFQVYGGVALALELKDARRLSGLERYHIWTPEFLEQRIRYRPEAPAWLLVIRAYRFPKAVARPALPEYAGCKSWVPLAEPVSLERAEPVLDNRRFRAALEQINSKLEGPA